MPQTSPEVALGSSHQNVVKIFSLLSFGREIRPISCSLLIAFVANSRVFSQLRHDLVHKVHPSLAV
jgi:hypothetical protein